MPQQHQHHGGEESAEQTRSNRARTKRLLDSEAVKYKAYSKDADPLLLAKLTPSQLIADLAQPSVHSRGWRPKPQIVGLLSTDAVQSSVDVDQPLFQPFPPEVVFHSYEPFKEYEAILKLRNNDKVARYVAVEHVASSFFKVQRLPAPKHVEGSKIAAGMEAAFRVTFTPDSISSYEQQLVVATERERFLVPLLAIGAAPALDLPDSIGLPAVAAKKTSKHSILVRNVGRASGSFQLSTDSSCFAVSPSQGDLAPGQVLQLTLEFMPTAPGLHEGVLEVLYDGSSRSTFTTLRGEGQALDVGLSVSEQQLRLPRTYMGKLSQRSFKIYNHSSTSVKWSMQAQPCAEAEEAVMCAALIATQQPNLPSATAATKAAAAADGPGFSIFGTLPISQHRGSCRSPVGGISSHRISISSSDSSAGTSAANSRCNSGNSRHALLLQQNAGAPVHGQRSAQQEQQPEQLLRLTTASSDSSQTSGVSLLADEQLAALRQAKRARRDICANRQLFSSPFFSVFPPEGCVNANSEQEVIVQFSPDCAGSFEEMVWLDIQGLGSRLPLQLQGAGLGPLVVFSYGEMLDIGEAFVNAEHHYELELLNRGKVDAHWAMQHCHTRFGSKFTFSPESGVLEPGQGQLIGVRLLADCLGKMDETFQLQLQGSSVPVSLNIRGEVVGPQFALDTQQLDFGIVSFGFRYTQQVLLSNTGAIPLTFHWHMAEVGSPIAREFSMQPATGTILPHAKQHFQLEFQPQSVQHYNVGLVMDMPGITIGAARLPVKAECAVPIIRLAEGHELLQFGQVFVRYSYHQQFTLLNDSKLPAKFEVLPQDQASQSLGTYTACPSSGSIAAKGSCTVNLTLEASRLGRIQLPVYVRVAGSRNKPIQLVADAKAIGPSLEYALMPAVGQAAAGMVEPALLSRTGSIVRPAALMGDASLSRMSSTIAAGSASTSSGDVAAGTSAALLAEASHATSITSTSGAKRKPGRRNKAAKPGAIQWAAAASINFDKVQVLVPHTRQLLLRNPTLIDADVKFFVEGRDSVYEVEPRELVVPAGGEAAVLVRVLLDDTATFKDTLHVLVSEGADVNVPLEATGVGNTVVSEVLSGQQLEFGPQFVGRPWQMEVQVANMGRKSVGLTWMNKKLAEILSSLNKEAKATGKKIDASQLPAEQQPVFSITPEKVLLGSKETSSFLISGLSNKAGLMREQLECQASSTGGASSSAGAKPKPVFDIAVTAEVAAPLLQLSRQTIAFCYVHINGSNPQVMMEPLEVRNVSKLPLHFTIKAGVPFTIDSVSVSLQPDEAGAVNISFDPDYRHDQTSHTVKQRCLISYPDNPQKDWLDLSGSIEFPNLVFQTNSIDFGCILMDSMRRSAVAVTNPGTRPVHYSWTWAKPEGPTAFDAAGAEGSQGMSRLHSSKAPKPPVSQLFDILPIQGTLGPGQTEQMEFSFYAYPGVKATALAACAVVDGPTYEFQLSGESNSIKFDVTPQFFDCGMQPYDRMVDKEFVVNNSGKVSFEFSIDLSRLSRPGVIEAWPSTGKVAAGDKARIKMKVKAGVPERLMELVMVSVAHFEPIEVQVLIEGTYPMLSLNLPRVKDEAFMAAFEVAKSNSEEHTLSVRVNKDTGRMNVPALPLTSPTAARASFAGIIRGSIGPGSVTGTVTSAANAAGATRPSSAAKSQVSAVSGTSGKSRASVASAASVGAMLAKDRLAQIQAALPTEKRLENEAERLRLKQLLLLSGSSIGNAGNGNSRSNSRSNSVAGRSTSRNGSMKDGLHALPDNASATLAAEQSAATASSQQPGKRAPAAPKLPELSAGHYVLDFGCVTKGVNKPRKVKMTNMSSQQVAFVVDKQTLESFGFSMTSEASIKLAGAPECQSTEVTFTVMAAKSWLAPGPLELTLPLMLKGGPAVLLTLRALLEVPEVVPSTSVLDFGTITTGHSKVYTIQLHNPRAIPAEWSIKRPAVESPKLRDWDFFVAETAEGSLEPGAVTKLKVTFTPILGRDMPYTLALPIRVSNNPRAVELACSGKGYTPKVEFSTVVVNCGAILPRVPGQKPAEASLQLRNPGERPVEVVCLDLDSQYLADEEALRSLDIYNESGVTLVRPLAPGEATWPELLAAAAQKKAAQASAEAALAAAAQLMDKAAESPAGLAPAKVSELHQLPQAASPGAAAPSLSGQEGAAAGLAVPAPIPEPLPPLVILLYGPPLGGKSRQAALLSRRYGIPTVTVDGLLHAAYDLQQQAMASATETASEPGVAAGPSIAAEQQRQLHELLGKLLYPEVVSEHVGGVALSEASTAGGPAAKASPASAHGGPGSARPRDAAQNQPVPPTLAEAITAALKQALQQPQYQAGFVLDGVGSKYWPSAPSIARSVLQAIGLTCKTLQIMPDVAQATAAGSTAAAKSPPKGSRPPSSRPGSRPAAAAEPSSPPQLHVTKPDVWEGTQQVHVIELGVSKAEAEKRTAAFAAGLDVPGVDASAQDLLMEASFVVQQSPRQHPMWEDAGAPAQANMPKLSADATLEGTWAAYEQDALGLNMVFGGLAPTVKPVYHRQVMAEAAEAEVLKDIVGIYFTTGQVFSLLPPVPADQDLLPPPYELRVLQQPQKRPKRRAINNFKVWTMQTVAAADGDESGFARSASHQLDAAAAGGLNPDSRPGSSSSAAAPSDAGRPPSPGPAVLTSPSMKIGAKGRPSSLAPAASGNMRPTTAGDSSPDASEGEKRTLSEASRWVIPPKGVINLLVQFASDSVGKANDVLGFDVVCGERNNRVNLTAACDYPRINTEARNMYYKTAKARPSTPNVKQQFILPTSMFEFGPLLYGKDKTGYLEGAHPDHTAKFRITNNGLFPVHADFWLKSEGPPADSAGALPSADPKKKPAAPARVSAIGSKGAPAPVSPFSLHPISMDLAIDDTLDLSVFAFPATDGLNEDVVMCRLRDNPMPLEFPISVIGARPQVVVKLDTVPAAGGDTVEQPGSKSHSGPGLRNSEAGYSLPKSVSKQGAKGAKGADLTIQFDRLLLNKRDTQSFTISNTGLLPFKWRLAGVSGLPPEFKMQPSEGELAARSKVRVVVEFSAIKKQELSEMLALEVLDVAEALGVSKSIPIAIRGEAYEIHIDLKFPQESFAGVDFGPLRVVDDCMKQIIMKNTEKYDVKFNFTISSEAVRQLVTITPDNGVVPPNKEVPVAVHWNKDLSLKHEVSFIGNTDILLTLIEPATDQKEQLVPIKLTGHAQFSHYAITPARGLHFGPVTYNTLSKPRFFEVMNLGEFKFKLRVFAMPNKREAPAAAAAAAEKAAAEEAAKKAGGKAGRKPASAAGAAAATPAPPVPEGALQLGQFTLDPADAVIKPGCKQQVSVVFKAEGNSNWSALAGLDISERDPTDQPEGIPYELGGESCIPGIDASNVASIFEEHVVLSQLDPFQPVNCSFGLKDRAFNFGTLIAQIPGASAELLVAPSPRDPAAAAASGAPGKKAGRAAASAKPGARTSSAGTTAVAAGLAPAAAAAPAATAVVDDGSFLDDPGAAKANLKFINPKKVPCTVNFTIKPRSGHQPGVRFPMEVYPNSIIIPPHEYRHVTLAFCPRALQQYSATFEAAVVGGAADPTTASFVCEVRAEGALPSLSFQEPSGLDAAGRPCLKFGRVMGEGCNRQLPINVRNNGFLTATARIDMEPHPAFKLLSGPQVFTVESKKAATYMVEFTPPELATYSHELYLRVNNNPFEQYRVAITGEYYQEELAFLGLPPNGSLIMPDVHLTPTPTTPSSGRPLSSSHHKDARSQASAAAAAPAPAASAAAAGMPSSQIPPGSSSSSFTFTMVNNSPNKHYRYKWPEHPNLKFSPSVGHLHAGQAREMQVTFVATAPIKLDGQDIKIQLSQITYKAEPVVWDEVVAANMVASGFRVSSAARVATGLPGTGPKPGAEPFCDLVPKTQRDLVLKVSAVADSPRYECDAPAPAIVFRPTMMFQTRTFTFTLSNMALTALAYEWQILDKTGTPDASGLYALSHTSGTLAGGGNQQITLNFSPREVEDVSRTLVCHMPALAAVVGAAAPDAPGAAGAGGSGSAGGYKPLVREVTGKVMRPWCHFELPVSEYISGGQRNPELPGPSGVVELLDPATKVLEFESLGIKVRNTKRFFILNPTSISYEFVWAPVLPPAVAALGGPPPPSPFSCLVRKGTISEGRRYEMVFEYTPTSDVLVESFWSFSIPSQGIVVPFLLVGRVAEPRVSLDRPAINFGRVQLGMRTKLILSLTNDEHLPFSFALDKASYDASDALLAASGGKPLLDIQPAIGTVPPHSKVDLCAVFAPQEERPINYNVVVRVRNKPTPLQLNVKGEGYALSPSLLLELPDDSSLEMSTAGVNSLDFGQVVVNDRVVHSLSLVNPGRVNYDFAWDLGSNPRLSVKPAAGSVPKGERRVVELCYAPTAPDNLAGHLVRCHITNGPTYTLALSGCGFKPRLNISFLNHDFGPCHVFQQGMTPACVKLVLLNEDKQPVSFDTVFDNDENWQVASSACVLLPGQSTEVGITFIPTEAKEYNTIMPLRIMGLYDINVNLKGEGVPLLIEVSRPEQALRGISFGAVPCGSCCNRTLSLVNKGRAATSISFAASAELLERLGIDIIPAEAVVLKPRQTTEFTLLYRPKQRTRPFKEPLRALAAGIPQVITTLAGACTGLSVLLASDSVPFGTVVLGSRTTKRLLMSNKGDLGCKFVWNTAPLGETFSISPAEGFLAPGQDVKLEISFRPKAVNPDIRVEQLRCKLAGSAVAPAATDTAETGSRTAASSAALPLQAIPDLLLTLTGACAASEPLGDPVLFRCNVRTSTSKSLRLDNTSSGNWQLRPVINNEFWSGPEFVQVPAGGSAEYSLCYKPLTMTLPEGQPHKGSIFFPLPDGSGLLYILHGQADQPTPEAVIEVSLPAKTQHTQTLKVSNWLHKPQRFKIIKELLVGEVSTRLEGAAAIDVPALLEREYRLTMYSYTQGLAHARITFRNESTGEYTFYEVKLTSTAPAPIGRLSMECPVRNQTSALINISNPLGVPVAVKPTISSKQVSLVPASPVLAPGVTTSLEVRYRPLLVGTTEAVLKLDSTELGLYEWKLKLTGAPTIPEKPLAFSVPLGMREAQVLRFTHWVPEKAEYKCSFKSSSSGSTAAAGSGGVAASGSGFDAPATLAAPVAGPNGVEVECMVGFEPCALGEAVRDVLLLTSAAGGTYEVPLVGQCVPPKPQGPVDVSKGAAVVPFRNVFAVEAEFVYSIDNPAFFVARTSEKLPPKKPSNITISYKPPTAGSSSGSRTGKLTVACPKQTGTQWVFYLQA